MRNTNQWLKYVKMIKSRTCPLADRKRTRPLKSVITDGSNYVASHSIHLKLFCFLLRAQEIHIDNIFSYLHDLLQNCKSDSKHNYSLLGEPLRLDFKTAIASLKATQTEALFFFPSGFQASS